ncbi:MAG: ABC transporter ATP-binding protein [Dehalococcoidales bacterium]|nr:ABC transporter ATP-binding protein [Dehalococcoidales bacterium]
MNTAIKATKLTKSFARSAGYRDLLPWRKKEVVTALKELSLEVKERELFGLLGPNGAGKTTLIKILCGLVLPNSGDAWVLGCHIQKEEYSSRKLVAAVSVDERSFYWRLTGWQNLEFYASLYRVPRRQIRQRVEEALVEVGLLPEANVRFQNYSTGMRQRLAIARGLLCQPRVLFVDEPTRSLDPQNARAVRKLLREEVDSAGRTVVLATHNMEEAEAICDRVAILDKGCLITTGKVNELRSLFEPRKRYELEVRNAPDDLMECVSLTDGVIDCRREPQSNGILHFEVTLSNQPEALNQVLKIIVLSGGQVNDCRGTEIPLEDIFVQAINGGLKGVS